MSEKKNRPYPDVFKLGDLISERILVDFQGGRTAEGVLLGYDHLQNMVLENCILTYKEEKKKASRIVCRGISINNLCQLSGKKRIEKPQ